MRMQSLLVVVVGGQRGPQVRGVGALSKFWVCGFVRPDFMLFFIEEKIKTRLPSSKFPPTVSVRIEQDRECRERHCVPASFGAQIEFLPPARSRWWNSSRVSSLGLREVSCLFQILKSLYSQEQVMATVEWPTSQCASRILSRQPSRVPRGRRGRRHPGGPQVGSCSVGEVFAEDPGSCPSEISDRHTRVSRSFGGSYLRHNREGGVSLGQLGRLFSNGVCASPWVSFWQSWHSWRAPRQGQRQHARGHWSAEWVSSPPPPSPPPPPFWQVLCDPGTVTR